MFPKDESISLCKLIYHSFIHSYRHEWWIFHSCIIQSVYIEIYNYMTVNHPRIMVLWCTTHFLLEWIVTSSFLLQHNFCKCNLEKLNTLHRIYTQNNRSFPLFASICSPLLFGRPFLHNVTARVFANRGWKTIGSHKGKTKTDGQSL